MYLGPTKRTYALLLISTYFDLIVLDQIFFWIFLNVPIAVKFPIKSVIVSSGQDRQNKYEFQSLSYVVTEFLSNILKAYYSLSLSRIFFKCNSSGTVAFGIAVR